MSTRGKGEIIAEAVVEDPVVAAERLRTAPAPTPRQGISW